MEKKEGGASTENEELIQKVLCVLYLYTLNQYIG